MNVGYKYIKIIFYGYIFVILAGATLLSLPFAHIGELSFIDALFTSTSATCVTGLIVVSTSENFTFWGEFIILSLIQIGGIGYMTLVTLFFLYLKTNLSVDEKKMMKHSLDLPSVSIEGFTKKIIGIVLVIELLGILILTVSFSQKFPLGEALWQGIFHAISSFNNAGFSLFTDSVIGYQKDFTVLFTLSMLTILGGLGFIVLIELYKKRRYKERLAIHTRIMLWGTLFLILFGMALFLSIEWSNPKTIGNFEWYDKLLNGFFLSVNFRTSGFNSVDLAGLKDSSLFFSTIFMMTGAGQGSTAGGIKVTTVAVLIIAVIYILKENNEEPHIYQRTIDQKIINKAMAIIMTASFLVLFATLLLVETQNLPFMKILFEVTSAFATVGVSTGNGGILSFSEQFDTFGKGVIIILMLAGRIGVFSFGVIMMGKQKVKQFKYPKGRILI